MSVKSKPKPKAKRKAGPDPPEEKWAVTVEGCEDGNHDWTVTYAMLLARGTARSLQFDRCMRCDRVHLGRLIKAIQHTFRDDKFWAAGDAPPEIWKRGKYGKKRKDDR